MRRVLTSREWASVALLSIIVPVGLLVSFRLTGVMKEPQRPETITVEQVSWIMSRPLVTSTVTVVDIDQWVGNSYSNSIAQESLRIRVYGYEENSLVIPLEGDQLSFRMIGAGNTSEGFLHSVAIRFSEIGANEIVRIERASGARDLDNFQEKAVGWSSRDETGVYFEAVGFNQPKNGSVSILVYWNLLDRNNMDQSIRVTLEAMFFDGSIYSKVIIPVRLNVQIDAGDNFETAKRSLGHWVLDGYSESLGDGDFDDYLAFEVEDAQELTWQLGMLPNDQNDFDLYVYDPSEEFVASSATREKGSAEQIRFTTDSVGWWYIRINDPIRSEEKGTYKLSLALTYK